MRTLLLTTVAALAAIAALALAAPASAGKGPLVVAMHDPGCHWFYVGGKYTKTAAQRGPVTLLNRDEATLIVKGPGGTRLEKVGAKLTVRGKGTYRINMVHQAPDDNTLVLRVS
jgi:hypothetical protein